MEWGEPGEGYHFIGHGLPAELDPLPEFHAAAENNRQRDNQLMIDAMQLRMAENLRYRAQVENDHALHDGDILWPAMFGRQAEAAAVQAAAIRHEKTKVEAEGGRLNLGIPPPVPQNPARNYNAVAGIQAGADKAMGPGEDNDAERRRQPKDRLGRMVGNLEEHGEERRRLVGERIGKLRAAAQDHEEARRRLARANLDQLQIKAQDEELLAMNEQLDRLRAQMKNVNAAEPAGERNDAREPRRGLLDRFRGQFANLHGGEPMEGRNEERDVGQRRDRMWQRFGRRQDDPPAEVLRQQQILEHEERKIQRSQQMARLRREQEHDEAATARRLEILRQNNFMDVVENQIPIDLADSPEPEGFEDSEEADEADDEDDYEDDIWF
jgi:hypothetical protein